jgi:hypothetical protein
MRASLQVTRSRPDILTAVKSVFAISPYAFGLAASMSTTTKPSALTFDLKARCSVR